MLSFSKFKFVVYLLLAFLLMSCSPHRPWACTYKVTERAQIESKLLPEASGLARSTLGADVFYHITDNSKAVFITNMKGENPHKADVKMPKAHNSEDLAQGPCMGRQHCIVVADTGNSNFNRDEFMLHFLEESPGDKEPELKLIGDLRLTVPTPAPDMEAVAIHPLSGEIYFFSKEFKENNEGKVSVYKVTPDEVAQAQKTDTPVKLVQWTVLDVAEMVELRHIKQYRVTSADISPDGKRLIILFRKGAIQLKFKDPAHWDLSQGLKSPDLEAVDLIGVVNLVQQEAVVYLPDGKTFVYTTEIKGDTKTVPMYEAKCPTE